MYFFLMRMGCFTLFNEIFLIIISRMTYIEQFLAEVEAYANHSKCSPSTVCRLAGQAGHFYRGLKAEGKQAMPRTLESIKQYMRDNPPAGDRAA